MVGPVSREVVVDVFPPSEDLNSRFPFSELVSGWVLVTASVMMKSVQRWSRSSWGRPGVHS